MSEATRWFLIRSRSGTWRSHVGLSAVLLFMCWQFAVPPPTFPLSSSYRAFQDISPDEGAWAVFFGRSGLLGIAGTLPVLERFYAVRVTSCAVLAAVQPLLADPAARTVGPDFWPWHPVAARALVDAGRAEEAVALLDGAPMANVVDTVEFY